MNEKLPEKPPGYEFGRPTKYRDEYCEMLVNFFERKPFEYARDKDGKVLSDSRGKPVLVPCLLPTFERFAANIGVSMSTFYKWAQDHEHFSDAKKIAAQIQKDLLIQNGLTGAYNPSFAIFTGKAIADMRDGNERMIEEPAPLETTYEVIDARKAANGA